MDRELMIQLGKEAAFMLPPKTTGRGRRKKVKKKKSLSMGSSNRQSPHRYGRKVHRKNDG